MRLLCNLCGCWVTYAAVCCITRWYNRDPLLTSFEYLHLDTLNAAKNRDLAIPKDQADAIADAAFKTVLTPPDDRDFDKCQDLNQPVEKN